MIVYEDVNTLPKVSTVVYEVDNPIIDDELVEADDKEVLFVNEAEDIHDNEAHVAITGGEGSNGVWFSGEGEAVSWSVSKQWKSFVDSSEFIACYGARRSQPHHLLLSYKEANE
nr:hypothetical protein [Tanacetum cinerariifolium]